MRRLHFRTRNTFALLATGMLSACSNSPYDGEPSLDQTHEELSSESAIEAPKSDASKVAWTGDRLQRAFPNLILVKFKDGEGIEAHGGRLFGSSRAISTVESAVQARSRRFAFKPAFSTSREALKSLRLVGERNTGKRLPDLSMWHSLYVDLDSREQLAELINHLNSLEAVETATPEYSDRPELENVRAHVQAPARWPTPEELAGKQPSRVDAAFGANRRPVAPGHDRLGALDSKRIDTDWIKYQFYLGPQGHGFNLDKLQIGHLYATGGAGSYVTIDAEFTRDHREFLNARCDDAYMCCDVVADGCQTERLHYLQHNPDFSVDKDRLHGTSTLGIVASDYKDTTFVGMSGMTPDANIALADRCATNDCPSSESADAIISAAGALPTGGVISVILQTRMEVKPGCACSDKYVPMEYRVQHRQAINYATAAGRHVIEAAGNGANAAYTGCSINDTCVGINGLQTDAVIVGGSSLGGINMFNWGTLVALHARGEGVYTTGHAASDLLWGTTEQDGYRNNMGGTSAATPQIAGLAVALNSVAWGYHGSPLNPREMREVLSRLGTAQSRVDGVGTMPDALRAADYIHNRHLYVHRAKLDGDNSTDYAIWEPGTGQWRFNKAGTSTILTGPVMGQRGDIPMLANFVENVLFGNPTYVSDFAVFRPTTGEWIVRQCSPLTFECTNKTITTGFGTKGDLPFPMQYDPSTPTVELAVFTPGNGDTSPHCPVGVARWRIRPPSSGILVRPVIVCFGGEYDTPLVGDFDGDGRDDLAVYHYDVDSQSGEFQVRYYPYTGLSVRKSMGVAAVGVVPMTFRENSKTNLAVWDPVASTVYRWSPSTGVMLQPLTTTTNDGDLLRFADRNGDGTDELVAYSPWSRSFTSGPETVTFAMPPQDLQGQDSYALSK